MKWIKFFLTFISFFIVLFNISPAKAAIMLQSGLFHEYSASPGSTITGTFSVRNTGRQWNEVKLYQEDLRIRGNGEIKYIPAKANAHPRSNSSWIRLESDRMRVRPNSTQTMIYTIKVPNNPALHGTYWSVVHLTPVSRKSPESQLNQQAKSQGKKVFTIYQEVRYAVQVLVHIGNRGKPNLGFTAPSIEKLEQKKRYFVFDILNKGIRYSRPDVWLQVFDKNGNQSGKFEAELQGLYPGVRKRFKIDISYLDPSNYKALLAAKDHISGQIFGSDIDLIIKP